MSLFTGSQPTGFLRVGRGRYVFPPVSGRRFNTWVDLTVRKLLVASQKSSSGKTTTAINLAAATALKGSRVLLVDVDPVGTVSMALNLTSHKNRKKLQDMFAQPLHG